MNALTISSYTVITKMGNQRNLTMDKMKDVALLAGRVLLALMFVMAGWGKIAMLFT